MSVHPRKEIRDSVVTILKGHTAAGQNVFSNQSESFKESRLPAINVYTQSESSQTFSSSSRELKRTMSLVVELAARDADEENVDNTLDALALQVETLLEADSTLNGKASDSELKGTAMGFASDGKTELAICRLTFDVLYYTLFGVTQPADAFASAHYVLKPASATADSPQVEGSIALEQE